MIHDGDLDMHYSLSIDQETGHAIRPQTAKIKQVNMSVLMEELFQAK